MVNTTTRMYFFLKKDELKIAENRSVPTRVKDFVVFNINRYFGST